MNLEKAFFPIHKLLTFQALLYSEICIVLHRYMWFAVDNVEEALRDDQVDDECANQAGED